MTLFDNFFSPKITTQSFGFLIKFVILYNIIPACSGALSNYSICSSIKTLKTFATYRINIITT